MKIIGIDPGANGAIVILDGNEVQTIKMPETPQDLLDILLNTNKKGDCFCFLEKVGGMPGMGGSSMFNFGRGYGHLEMALLAAKIPFETVTPQKWQKLYQLGTKSQCATGSEWKNKLKEKAQQLFPNVKMTLAFSDAILIAEYGRRIKK